MPEIYITSFNQRLTNVHDIGTCAGKYCTVHNWSNHHMQTWPQWWREDKLIMERVCVHKVGHPDPDEPRLDIGGRGAHGCDGCCKSPSEEITF